MGSRRFGDDLDRPHRRTARCAIGVVVTLALIACAAPAEAITRMSTSTVANTTATRTVTVTSPSQTQPGDVLVACLALNGGGVSASGEPPGWSRFAATAAPPFNPRVYGYSKVAGSSEPAEYTWTLDGAVANGAGIARYSGVDAASPLDASAASASGRSAGSGTVAGVTTTTADALLVGCMAINSSKTSVAISAPAGMSQVWSLGGKRHQLAEGLQPAIGASGPKTWTFSASREWAGWLTALRPAASSPPVPTAPPVVSGSPVVGATLTSIDGSWMSGTPLSFARQWRRCDSGGTCVDVGTGATTYQLVAADVGYRLLVEVTATNSAGSATASSAPTEIVVPAPIPQPPANTAPPAVSGPAVVGSQLTASDGVWTGDPLITFTRQWRRCDSAGACVDVGTGATTYQLVAADVGYRLLVEVTATNSAGRATASSLPTEVVAPAPVADPVVTAVGDVTSSATNANAIAVRDVVAAQSPTLHLQLGDYQYSYGSVGAILSGADRIWGPKPGGLWPSIRPTAGPSHDVTSCSESDYQAYWGRPALQGYSFDLGTWHLISLPSAIFRYRCETAGVLAWLNNDLDTHPNACTLAFWHEPYWTRPTATHQRELAVRPWIDALYAHGADVILSSHQHDYQRFAPQNPSDQLDTARGIREFVVGTGGIGLYPFTGTAPNVEASDATTFGALKLTLHPSSYDFEFLRAAGGSFTDSGSGTCH